MTSTSEGLVLGSGYGREYSTVDPTIWYAQKYQLDGWISDFVFVKNRSITKKLYQ